jgi:2-keto-4-pentenoate hydratase/2-oxohepta-3-ene-1,7-dioic acid hydratase in catechol pathway
VVIGRETEAVPEARALEFVAGYCVGQDVSDRGLQFSDRPPQFSLGKSRATFGPCGPAIVTLDELVDPLDLAIRCDLDDETVQQSRTREMIFNVPELLGYLSRHCRLLPGDLIFTGTPAGVGSVRDPRRYLQVGETITTEIEGLGQLVNACVTAESGSSAPPAASTR